jgi:hypothetical protein
MRTGPLKLPLQLTAVPPIPATIALGESFRVLGIDPSMTAMRSHLISLMTFHGTGSTWITVGLQPDAVKKKVTVLEFVSVAARLIA